jgi:ribosomal protein L40E
MICNKCGWRMAGPFEHETCPKCGEMLLRFREQEEPEQVKDDKPADEPQEPEKCRP